MTIPSASLSFHAWPLVPPGGQQVSRIHLGVLVLHIPTGIAVVCESERSRHANQLLATERLVAIVETARVTWRADLLWVGAR